MMTDRYAPPYRITSGILHGIEQIGEALGKLRFHSESAAVPVLWRGNRIKTVHASLAIEGNSLSLEQVTSVLTGKWVLAQPHEIQEVRNTFAAYEKLPDWTAHSRVDLLAAHGLLMAGLVDEAGRFRTGGVGIQRGGAVIHVAPSAERVPALMDDLLAWLEKTDEHPLVASCVFHYELEFIHPFEDGNGRLGRLWQTLILSQWRPIFAFLPVESIIRDRQQDYYAALGQAVETAFFKHVFTRYYQISIAFSYWRGGKEGQEVDIIADIGERLVPFEVKYQGQSVAVADLKGLVEFCRERKVQRAYVITKDAADFGILPLPGGAQALKIPAPLACYWLGRSELESPDLQNLEA